MPLTPAGISYDLHGPAGAPALLFINSIGSTRELWDAQRRAFETSHRVIRYDASGHGRSAVPPGPYAISDLAHDALAILDAEGIAAAAVCGISLGGLTAMWLGVHAPARVTALVLANTGAKISTLESWTARIQLVREHGMRGVADVAIPLWFTEAFRAREPATDRRGSARHPRRRAHQQRRAGGRLHVGRRRVPCHAGQHLANRLTPVRDQDPPLPVPHPPNPPHPPQSRGTIHPCMTST